VKVSSDGESTLIRSGYITQEIMRPSFTIAGDDQNNASLDDMGLAIESLGASGKGWQDIVSMVDVERRLGSVIVATRNYDDTFTYHGYISLEEVSLAPRHPETLRGHIYTNRDRAVSTGAFFLFGSATANMSYDSVYSLTYQVSRNVYENPFEVQLALQNASPDKLQAILSLLEGNPMANVYTIHRIMCIENAMFSLIEGESVSVDASASVAVATAMGTFNFNHERQQFYQSEDYAIEVVPALVSSRSFLKTYLRSKIRGSGRGLKLGEPSIMDARAGAFTSSLGAGVR